MNALRSGFKLAVIRLECDIKNLPQNQSYKVLPDAYNRTILYFLNIYIKDRTMIMARRPYF